MVWLMALEEEVAMRQSKPEDPAAEAATRGRLRANAVLTAGLVSFTWLTLAGLEWWLASGIVRSTLNDPVLSAEHKRAMMAGELQALFVAVVVCILPLLAARTMLIRLLRTRPITRRVALGGLGAAAWGLLLLFAASWATFRSTGVFLAPEGLVFFGTNMIQFLQHVAHMEPDVIVMVPLVVTAAALLIAWVVPALLRGRRGAYLAWPLVTLTLAGLSICGWWSWRGSSVEPEGGDRAVFDPNVGVIYTLGELHQECRDNRTGPLLYLLADLRRQWAPPETLRVSHDLSVDWRPIISMDEYLDDVTSPPTDRWNVILVLVESLRSDQLRAYGNNRDVMPAVDRVASEGRVFLNHYTQSSHSNYSDLCPLTSHYPLRSDHAHVYSRQATAQRVLIYDILHATGYRTAIISSQNENWGGMLDYLETDGLDHLFHADTFDGPTYVPRGDTGFEAFVKGEKRSGKIDDRFTVSEAINWIDSVGDNPFFIYMNLQNSHLPYETPRDFPRRFGRDRLPFVIRFNNYPPDGVPLVKEEYANSLAYVDFQLDRLFDHLEVRGLWDRTIIIISGDTGQAFYEHGFAAHANALFDEVMRVPLVIRGPNIEPGTDARPAQHIDVPPTLLAQLGLPPHPSFQGEDLFRTDPDFPRALHLVAQCPSAHQYAIVRDGFKLIHDARSGLRVLLNLQADPGETRGWHNTYPETGEQLAERLDTWRHWQLEYYRNIGLHGRYYPPILQERVGESNGVTKLRRDGR